MSTVTLYSIPMFLNRDRTDLEQGLTAVLFTSSPFGQPYVPLTLSRSGYEFKPTGIGSRAVMVTKIGNAGTEK